MNGEDRILHKCVQCTVQLISLCEKHFYEKIKKNYTVVDQVMNGQDSPTATRSFRDNKEGKTLL